MEEVAVAFGRLSIEHGMPSSPENVRCDRKSILGNPFIIEGEERRDAACDAHEAYLEEIMAGSLDLPALAGGCPPVHERFTRVDGGRVKKELEALAQRVHAGSADRV
jgi:hypothetical protein